MLKSGACVRPLLSSRSRSSSRSRNRSILRHPLSVRMCQTGLYSSPAARLLGVVMRIVGFWVKQKPGQKNGRRGSSESALDECAFQEAVPQNIQYLDSGNLQKEDKQYP